MSTYVVSACGDCGLAGIELREEIERLPIEALSEREWEVLLARLQGATHQEAARAAGLSSVSSAHHAFGRAIEKLRK